MILRHPDPALRDRAVELLAERAVFGLDGDDALELDRLLLRFPELDETTYDLVVATLEPLAIATSDGGGASRGIPDTMSDALRVDLIACGEAWVRAHAPVAPVAAGRIGDDSTGSAADAASRIEPLGRGPEGAPTVADGTPTATRSIARHGGGDRSGIVGDAATTTAPVASAASWMVFGGWIAAAAVLLVAVMAWVPSLRSAPSPERELDRLLASATDLVRSEWSTPGHDLVDDFLCGEVVWSNELQRGFLIITGLKPNDPSASQYQLWIFDATRDADHPVDGGVFDIPVTEGIRRTVIPIDPKLPIRSPTLFAVTVEPPGGVVVSKRDIALLASLR